MGLTKAVLKRPVTTLLAVLCLIVFGIQSINSAKLELMPTMDMPMLIISTIYPGASPEDINDLVTTEIESGIGSLSGIDEITSMSLENYAITVLQYDYGMDMDAAYDDLKKKVDVIEASLPDDCESPTIVELNMDDTAVMSLTINHATEPDLYNYVNNKIVPELETITTISDVSVSGGQEAYIQIELLSEKLSQYGLTMSSIATTIGGADFTYPTGSVVFGNQDLSVSTGTEYATMDVLGQIPIMLSSGQVIHLEDVANINYAKEDQSSISRYNGNDTISISIKKQQSATAGEVSKEVQVVIDELLEHDSDLEINIVNDTNDSIISSLSSVLQTMLLAIVVSMIIIFLFFGEIKASLIVGTSIPLSILTAIIFMTIFGFTLNVITLSGLVLGVGMMVDNSIVVLESCFRSTKGKGIVGYKEAALEGSGIVIQSVIASTITTCVVFIPLALLEGMSGQMFKPLGFTIIFCMVASLISAITVVPLFYCMYRPREKEQAPMSRLISSMQTGYRNIMQTILPKRKTVVAISVGLLALSIAMATQLQMELIPADDTGTISISIETRPGLQVKEQNEIYLKIEEVITKDSDLDSYLLTSDGNNMFSSGTTLTAYLKDDRARETDEVTKEWETLLANIPDVNIQVSATASVSMMTSSSELEYILHSTQYDELKEVADQIKNELLLVPEISKVSSTLDNAAPVVKLDVDVTKAYAQGITPIQVATTVSSTLDGTTATTIDVDGEEVDVIVEYPKGMYESIDQLEGIMLTSQTGAQVPLTSVADIAFKDSPASITRTNKQYEVTISGDMATDDSREQEALEARLYDEIVSKYMTPSITLAQNAMDAAMMEEFTALVGAILTAVFLIFVVMAAQFESPKFSLMVMTTIPFALIGSFGLLYLVDVSISMPSLLGFLMLIGTVVNNGILYVDTVNYNRQTMDLNTALIEAGAMRLRPILMTTLTTLVAMVPMAFAYGDTGNTMQGLALVNMGGLIASTALALLMLPAYYSLMTKKVKVEPHYD